MSSKSSGHIPVVDVDQAFPTLVGTTTGSRPVTPNDLGPEVRAAIRDVLGVRSRVEDPKAFTDALNAAFRLVRVEGHVESEFVPRGYAIQADLGAVTGGQASLYRRATLSRTEILRILDGLVPLRVDGDVEDMDAYRTIIRNAVQSLVDELGAPGGPRVAMVDTYLKGLLGGDTDQDPDAIGGQLGALRDRFGLIDDNVNTIEEEGLRTAFWTLVDMVADLNDAWNAQRGRFTGAPGGGFLGTDLILISRLMEAAADQVDELEAILDSVLLPQSERQTIRLSDEDNLTLDGLLSWLRAFLADEGRRLAQDAGRDGIVAALAPTSVELARTFRELLLDPITQHGADGDESYPFVRYLRSGAFRRWPHGMFAARVEICASGLGRLLTELARRAQRIGRFAGVVLTEAELTRLDDGISFGKKAPTEATAVSVRALNVREQHEVCFLWAKAGSDPVRPARSKAPLRPLTGSASADEDSLSGTFGADELDELLRQWGLEAISDDSHVTIPAQYLPLAVRDRETGELVHAPRTVSWPQLFRADRPHPLPGRWKDRASRHDRTRAEWPDGEGNGTPEETTAPWAEEPDASAVLVTTVPAPAAPPVMTPAKKTTTRRTPVRKPAATKAPARTATAKKQGGQ